MTETEVPFTPTHVTVYRGVGVPATPGTTIMVPESHLANLTAANEAARARAEANTVPQPEVEPAPPASNAKKK